MTLAATIKKDGQDERIAIAKVFSFIYIISHP